MILAHTILGLAVALSADAAQSLEKAAPRAAGICLAEIVAQTPFDARPMDGNAEIRVKLKVVRSSGRVDNKIVITTAWGGHRKGPPPKTFPGPIRPGTLKTGKRYWFAFSSRYEYGKHRQGVIGFWPQFAPKVGDLFDRAVTADHYKWQPQFDPKIGLTHGYLINGDLQHCRVRVTKGGKRLWEKTLTGKSVGNSYYEPSFTHSNYMGFPSKLPRCGKVLTVNLVRKLPEQNEYSLPADQYNISTGLDPETGDRLAVWILLRKTSTQTLHREYAPKTGRLVSEHRYSWVKDAKDSAGGWWKRTHRTFDAKSGEVIGTEEFRYDPKRDGDRWVKITAARAR